MTSFTIVPPAQTRPSGPARERLAGRHGPLLRTLAGALDVPAETFLCGPQDGPQDGEAGELFALVRHWLAIGDSQGRRRVLSLARQEAERSGYSECA